MMAEDSSPRRNVSGTRRKRWLAGGLLLPLGVAVLLGVAWLRGWGSTERKPPAPNAPKAQQWTGTKPPKPQSPEPSEQSLPEVVFEKEPGPQIHFDNVPEVPERLLGPSPPIAEDSRVFGPRLKACIIGRFCHNEGLLRKVPWQD